METSAPTYRFGKFTLNACDHRLWSDGQEIYLRPKTYDTLVYLLEHQVRLVTRNELLDAVWSDVEVTENVLSHCVQEVRAALDDDVQNPRFLKTLPRLGYEFIAHVQGSPRPADEEVLEEELRALRVITTEEDSNDAPSYGGAAPGSAVVSTPSLPTVRRAPNLRSVATAAALLLSLSAVSYLLLRSRGIVGNSSNQVIRGVLGLWSHNAIPALTFAPRDYVLISDFENDTGDPIFDRSLTTALASSLDQSSVANVYSPARVRETLKRMEKPNVEHVDEALALEIAEREGIKAIVVPTISGVGESYRLSARVRAVSSGRDIRTEVYSAKSKEKVLDAVDQLAAAVRRDLGESLQKISESKPLSAATTQSLEALK